MAFILLKNSVVNVNQKFVVLKAQFNTIMDSIMNYFDFSSRTKHLQVISAVKIDIRNILLIIYL